MLKKNDVALKESSISVDLVGDGSLVCLLKKTRSGGGGLSPDNTREFFLFPMQGVVSARDLQDRWASRGAEIDDFDGPGGMVRFAHYARMRALARFTKVEALARFTEFYPYTEGAAARRYHESPAGIDLMVLRVYKLRQPLMMVDRPMYDGTQSWVKLEAALSTRGCEPVMSRGDFELRVAEVKARVEEVGGLEL